MNVEFLSQIKSSVDNRIKYVFKFQHYTIFVTNYRNRNIHIIRFDVI